MLKYHINQYLSLKIILVALYLIFLGLPQESQAISTSIIAVVGDKVITDYDLETRNTLVRALTNKNHVTTQEKSLLLEQMVDELIIYNTMKSKGYELSDVDIESAFKNLIAGNNTGEEKFIAMLDSHNISLDTFKEYLKLRLTKTQYMKVFIEDKINIKKSEISKNRTRVVKSIMNEATVAERLKLSEIIVFRDQLPINIPLTSNIENTEDASVNTKQINSLPELGEYITQQLSSKKSTFADMAEAFSRGGTAAEGGELEWLDVSSLSDLYLGVSSSLKVGEVSKPLLSKDVLIFIKLDNVKSKSMIKEKEITDEMIEQFLRSEKVEDSYSDHLKGLRAKSYYKIHGLN